MAKFNFLIIIFFLFSHCSIDTKTGLWEDKNLINNDKKLTEYYRDKYNCISETINSFEAYVDFWAILINSFLSK